MKTPPSTVADLLTQARTAIDVADADILLAHALGKPRSWLFAHAHDMLGPEDAVRFQALAARRSAGEPVAYLTGTRGFWTLELDVSPATLIPRPETELLVEQALARLPEAQPLQVADLGTGSGAVALALAKERPQAQVVATDFSSEALEVAKRNAVRNRITNVSFRCGSWLQPLAGMTFDMIVSNPPYIAAADPHLTQGDLRFEPASALASGDDGLDAIRSILLDAGTVLRAGGWLLLEHGWEQGAAIRQRMALAGYCDVATVQDWEARDRVTLGRLR